MTFDNVDIDNLALVTYKEARGEGIQGCHAVMNVIVNRVGTVGFAHTLHDVIYGKNQFTSMSVASDPEYNLVPNQNDPVYMACMSMASTILSGGSNTDVTNGAHYYANLKNTTSGWFFNHIVADKINHPVTAVIGHHTFFK